ncbi:MAG: hypothetical protein M1834_004366 [Cirrosporium novae-zelandiae]|nr:MAG: hypothetical protein M1834_004366 [Cirrosporium novae-zelandiae]
MSQPQRRLPPPVPQKLQFGSDPGNYHAACFKTGQNRESSNQDSTPKLDNPERPSRDHLPPVSQLLTPKSFASVPPSPYSPTPDSLGPYSLPHGPAAREAVPPQSSPQQTDGYYNDYEVPPGSSLRKEYAYQPRNAMNTESTNSARITPFPYVTDQERSTFNAQPYTTNLPPVSQRDGRPESQMVNNAAHVPYSHVGPPLVHGTSGLGPGPGPMPMPQAPLKQNIMPRPIGEQVLPGEGPCYIYEDGSHCKTMINGEPVNASWGVTKAGKPRKRLAVACLNCREKKIKCDGNNPCFQCEKFGRACRVQLALQSFNLASRMTAHTSYWIVEARRTEIEIATSSPQMLQTDPFHRPRGNSHSAHDQRSTPESPLSRHNSQSSRSPHGKHRLLATRRSWSANSLTLQTPESTSESKIEDSSPLKRYRLSSPDLKNYPSYASMSNRDIAIKRDDLDQQPRLEKILPNLDSICLEWHNDPYRTDPELVEHYLDLYLRYINAGIYTIFPVERFRGWVRISQNKSYEDLMLVYSILALGSVFSERVEREICANRFVEIARFAVEHCKNHFSLQLVQSRLILALYYIAQDEVDTGWDFCGSAVRAACGFELNNEPPDKEDQSFEYGLTKIGSDECHRRTFWSAYLLDKQFDGLRHRSYTTSLDPDDIFLRLPCWDGHYENQKDVLTPYFDNDVVDPNLARRGPRENMGVMGYLVAVASIWENVMANVSRSVHRSASTYRQEHERHYSDIVSRLETFDANLPAFLRFNNPNLITSIRQGYLGRYMVLHSLYHACFMKLNRHIQPKYLQISSTRHSVREARKHATALLQMTYQLSTIPSSQFSDLKMGLGPVFSAPFMGYAIFIACDILTAGCPIDTFQQLLPLMTNSVKVLVSGVAKYWTPIVRLQIALNDRLSAMAVMAEKEMETQGPERNNGVVKRAVGALTGMEPDHRLDNEVLYSFPKEVLLEVAGFGDAEEWEGHVATL